MLSVRLKLRFTTQISSIATHATQRAASAVAMSTTALNASPASFWTKITRVKRPVMMKHKHPSTASANSVKNLAIHVTTLYRRVRVVYFSQSNITYSRRRAVCNIVQLSTTFPTVVWSVNSRDSYALKALSWTKQAMGACLSYLSVPRDTYLMSRIQLVSPNLGVLCRSPSWSPLCLLHSLF